MVKNEYKANQERIFRLIMDCGYPPYPFKIFNIKLEENNLQDSKSIKKAIKFSKSLEYNHPGLKSEVYFNHPLRVACLLLDNLDFINDEIIITALIHNIFELTNLKPDDLKAIFSTSIIESLVSLTVNRDLQYDYVYKKDYYEKIINTSNSCAKVKIADKLDNIYMINFNPNQKKREIYLKEIETFVIPMAKKVSQNLYDELSEAFYICEKIGYLDKELELEYIKTIYNG